MKANLQPGLTFEFKFKIPKTKTVPHLYPESELFREMPQVLATGFLVGLVEWTCIEAIRPFLDWPREQTLGTRVNLSHSAPTPPGLTVTVAIRLEKIDGRRLDFAVSAHDGLDIISTGTHERFIVDSTKFGTRVAEKAGRIAD
ncbi:MAG TPA: thioesterase family protein [Burkholderiales bacterium]|nr:thioesterase family protein [Burkholderiales bacterium]